MMPRGRSTPTRIRVGIDLPVDSRHVWWASPMNRTNAKNPTGCSVCNGKTVIPGVNDVATTHPDVAALMVNKDLP